MTGSLRLLLTPIRSATPDQVPVAACALDLTHDGSGTSKATKAAQPAKLEFIGRFTSSVRDKPPPEEKPLGELEGTVELKGTPKRGFFRCNEASLAKLREEPEEEESDDDDLIPFAPRALELTFSSAFGGVKGEGGKPRLFLPVDAGKFRYLEVVVRLTITSPEAEFEVNDVLDVLIRRTPPVTYPFSL